MIVQKVVTSAVACQPVLVQQIKMVWSLMHLVPKRRVGPPAGLRPVAQPLLGQQVQQAPRGAGAGTEVQLAAAQAVHVRREPRQDVVVRRRLPQVTHVWGVQVIGVKPRLLALRNATMIEAQVQEDSQLHAQAASVLALTQHSATSLLVRSKLVRRAGQADLRRVRLHEGVVRVADVQVVVVDVAPSRVYRDALDVLQQGHTS